MILPERRVTGNKQSRAFALLRLKNVGIGGGGEGGGGGRQWRGGGVGGGGTTITWGRCHRGWPLGGFCVFLLFVLFLNYFVSIILSHTLKTAVRVGLLCM